MVGKASIAKLSRPRLHAALPRERLFAMLDDFSAHPIRWIAAPPGAGKTTLAANWLEHRNLASCWYRIDERDHDPASLFYYLGEALRELAGDGERTLPLFTPEYARGLPAFAHRFFEAFFARLPQPFVLVIDDYHEIPADSLTHAALLHGLQELPDDVAVLILSRRDAPAEFARLRVSGTLAAVPPAELQLDGDETAGLLHLHGVTEAAQQRRIADYTQGWAAGVRLLMASEAEVPATPRGIDAASKESLFGYFAGEVFRNLHEAERRVLLSAALVPACTASLARQLSGEHDAGDILDRLYRHNYFVTRQAGRNEPLYRFHPLFHAFLNDQIEAAIPPEQQAWMRLSAANDLEEVGQFEEAITLRMAAQDMDGAAALIARAAGDLLSQGRHRTVTEWTNALPLRSFDDDPWLLYWKAVARMSFSPAEAVPWLENAYRTFDRRNDVDGLYKTWAALIQAIRFDHAGNASRIDPWIEEFDRLQARHPDIADPDMRFHVANSALEAFSFRRPKHPAIDYWKSIALEAATVGTATERSYTLFAQASWANRCGRLDEASHLLRLGPSPDSLGLHPISASFAYLAHAMNALFRADFPGSLRIADDAMTHLRVLGVTVFIPHLLGTAFGAEIGLGHLEQAKRRLDELASITDTSSGSGLIAAYYRSMLARLHYMRGEQVQALACARESVAIAQRSAWGWQEVQGWFITALASMEAGDIEGSGEALKAMNDMIEGGHGGLYAYGARLAEVRLLSIKGDHASATRHLHDALVYGREHGLVEFGHLRPDVSAGLFASALAHGYEVDYVAHQIRLLNLPPPAPETVNWPYPVRITTLGHFAIEIDGTPLRFTGKTPRKPLELLQAIVAMGGDGVPSEAVVAALWPDSEGDAADTALRVTLSRLRKLLGHEEAITYANGVIGLNRRICSVDVDSLASLNRSIAGVQMAGHPESDRLAQVARHLMSLCHGPFLADQREHPWMLAARAHWRDQLIALADVIGPELERAGDAASAIALYRHVLDQENLAETVYRRLMKAYMALGEHAEVLNVFRRCREALSITLGITPSEETRAIVDAVR